MSVIIPANTIPCITVRQPWAWAMFALGTESKDVENRSQFIHHHGPMAIHVAKSYTIGRFDFDLTWIESFIGRDVTGRELITIEAQLGHVIGIVDVKDCIGNSPSRWANKGAWHWVLANNRRVRSVPIKGQQGRFVCPVELEVLSC